jgi:DNA-binding LacI/PurR family transcriptional regulator
MSVTRTYSSPDKVSERIKKKVTAAAKELGYRPNILARSLRSGKSMTVGIVWSLCGPHDSGMVVREMAKKLFDHGYVSFISDSYSDTKIIKETLRNFAARQIDGLILHADCEYIMEDAAIIDILSKITHVVIVGRQFFDSPFDEIKISLLPSIEEIVSYWAQKGRKKIFYMTNPSQTAKINFFNKCLKKHGLSYSNNIIGFNYYGKNIGSCFQNALEENFHNSIPFDAVICSCDEGAAGIMDYLRQAGLKVPDDVAVCGCNDSQIAPYYNPRMASVNRKIMQTANLATETLLARLKGDKSPPQKIEIKMEFINRESAG